MLCFPKLISSFPGANPRLPEHRNADFVLGRANPCLPQRGNSPLCRLGATVRDAASGQLSPLPPSGNSPPCRRVRTLGPGSAVAERNLGAARPLRNVIVAAYPLRNVIGSSLSIAKRNRCAVGLLFMLPLFRIFEFLCDRGGVGGEAEH